MSNASAAAITLASGAPIWVVILVTLLTNEHVMSYFSARTEDAIDVLVALGGKKLTKRVARLREARRTQ